MQFKALSYINALNEVKLNETGKKFVPLQGIK